MTSPTNDNRPTHLDLFSGIGGFSLAFEAEGFRTIGFSEIDPYASAVLRKHWPDVPNYGDVRNIKGVGADVVTGGFPCQPFSVAGKRRGAEDDRHLWPEMLRVISESKPAWILGENVPGIIGMELDNVLSDLENIGFTCWPVVVPACAVDARHRRDRVWIVAHSRGDGRACVWKEGHCVSVRAKTASDNTERGERQPGACPPCAVVADTAGERRREEGRLRPDKSQERAASGCETLGDSNEGGIRCGRAPWSEGHTLQPSWWPTEPELGRVAHGIPNRSHRLKCLGNAIVPQVAQIFARAIFQSLNHTTKRTSDQ